MVIHWLTGMKAPARWLCRKYKSPVQMPGRDAGHLETCPSCGHLLRPRRAWHMRKTVQMLAGPRFIAGRSKECINADCAHAGQHYYASGVLMFRLPRSTYGLEVLAFIC